MNAPTVEIPVDAIVSRAKAMRPAINWRKVLAATVLAVPFILGRTVGLVVTVTVFACAAFAEGYAAGRKNAG